MKRFAFVHWSKRETPVLNKLKAGPVLTGLAWALGATLVTCALMCAWVVLASGPVYNLSAFITAGSFVGAFAGGVAGGKVSGAHGSLHGLLVGLLYGLLLVALFMAGSAGGLAISAMLARAALLGITGAVGGLFGVNMYERGRGSSKRKISMPRNF